MGEKKIHLASFILSSLLLCSLCWGLENKIINGEFDAGIEPWQRSVGEGYNIEVVQGASLSGLNALKIDISNVNAQESIMITHSGLFLERGATYHIGFTAKADADRQIGLLLEYNNVWAYTWHKWIDLTTSPQTFTFEFINGHSSTDTIVLYFILKHPWFPLLNENENIDAYIEGVYVVQEPPADPNLAHYPWPADGAVHEDLWAVLSWSQGRYATSHNVYVGKNFEDVNSGTGDIFHGNHQFTWLPIGFPDYTGRWLDLMNPGSTIYWRVDEVNDMHPGSPWKGDIWSFWIPPRAAYNPKPNNNAEFIDPNITLSWMPGFRGESYIVYFGSNFDGVNNASGGNRQQATSYIPGQLEQDKTYYWRVDMFDQWGSYYKGDTWSFSTKPAGPNIAHDPYPADGAMHPDNWVTMTWSPGIHATSHDFYFGYNFEDVNNGTGDIYYWNETNLFVVAGFFHFPWEGLIPGTMYYWRVDEVNELHPESPWKGDIWSFGIPPYNAYDPVPADGAAQIDPYVTLSWKAGFNAESHYIYFGDNFDDVNDVTVGIPQETTTYTPGPLEFDKTYYWWVDESSLSGIYKGKVWSFSTKLAGLNTAYDPYPADGTEIFDPNVTLSWEAGFGAKLHVLYFGENSAEVEAGIGGTFKGILTGTSYLPDHLEIDKTYYWRVNEFDVTTTHKGQIWSFSTKTAKNEHTP
jgi:hypothetical protein